MDEVSDLSPSDLFDDPVPFKYREDPQKQRFIEQAAEGIKQGAPEEVGANFQSAQARAVVADGDVVAHVYVLDFGPDLLGTPQGEAEFLAGISSTFGPATPKTVSLAGQPAILGTNDGASVFVFGYEEQLALMVAGTDIPTLRRISVRMLTSAQNS